MRILSRPSLIGANILWALIVFTLCALPGDSMPDTGIRVPHLDKVVHFGMFFITSLLLALPLHLYARFRRWHILLLAVAFAFLYGGALEILQDRFFGRSGDPGDLVADLVGAFAGCLCYPYLLRFLASRDKK